MGKRLKMKGKGLSHAWYFPMYPCRAATLQAPITMMRSRNKVWRAECDMGMILKIKKNK